MNISKPLRVSIAVTAVIVSTAVYSGNDRSKDPDNDKKALVWNLPSDVLGTSNQISFSQGANGVWYFMESNSLSHDPLQYRFLPNYTAPCSYGSLGTQPGVACWCDNSTPLNTSNFVNPKISINASNNYSALPGENPYFPPRTLAQMTLFNQLSVVAWKSPVDGKVSVSGFYRTLQSCANGVVWSVDKGGTTLKSALLVSGTGNFNLPQLYVKKGEAIYFTLDPNGEDDCDNTALNVTITYRDDGWRR